MNFFLFIYTKNLLPREKQQNARLYFFFFISSVYFCAPLWFWSWYEFNKSSDCIHLDLLRTAIRNGTKNIMRRKKFTPWLPDSLESWLFLTTCWRKFTPVRDNVWVQTDRKGPDDGVNEMKNVVQGEHAWELRDARAAFALQGLSAAWSCRRMAAEQANYEHLVPHESLYSQLHVIQNYTAYIFFGALVNDTWFAQRSRCWKEKRKKRYQIKILTEARQQKGGK